MAGDPGPEPGPRLDPLPKPKPDVQIAAIEPAETPVDAVESEVAPEDFGTVGRISTSTTPREKPDAPPASQVARTAPETQRRSGGNLIQARELFSRDPRNETRLVAAMRGMPEGQRLNLLCMTELRAQLTAVSPLPPELLPSFRPRGGKVLEPRNAAFRALGRWYDVNFRCETDAAVTRVVRFAFRIGEPIPRSQWLQRGLTGF
ncbi:MAG: DUF930 domain-containing protein [Roseibium sp.]|nr:DUF930 domain-containing protein [Roseibium sp.]